MWVPTDDGFLAAQAQEALALARADIAGSAAPPTSAAIAAASMTANTALRGVSDPDADTEVQVAVVAVVLLFWLLLCGLCRCYVCLPCPCCVCYIPCCCGFCLPKEPEKLQKPQRHDVHHHHHHPPARRDHRHQHSARLPAYGAELAVDMNEPLLGARTYTGPPPGHDVPPPAFYDVPTAPPLSPP